MMEEAKKRDIDVLCESFIYESVFMVFKFLGKMKREGESEREKLY